MYVYRPTDTYDCEDYGIMSALSFNGFWSSAMLPYLNPWYLPSSCSEETETDETKTEWPKVQNVAVNYLAKIH